MNLREELLALDGIAAAELDGDHTTPSGVRVRLAPGADPDAVGRDVQRILAAHGMRSHMTDAEPMGDSLTEEPVEPAAVAAPVEPAVVAAPVEAPVEQPPAEEPLPVTEARPPVAVSTSTGDLPPPPPGALRAAVGAEVVRMPGVAADPVPVAETSPGPGADDGLASVAVEETRTGVTVRVTTELGRQLERSVAAAGPMVDIAIVEAVGALLASPPPEVVAVNDHLLDGTDVILVVVDHGDGTRTSGSAVIDIGRPFAVGTAAWRAVSAQV